MAIPLRERFLGGDDPKWFFIEHQCVAVSRIRISLGRRLRKVEQCAVGVADQDSACIDVFESARLNRFVEHRNVLNDLPGDQIQSQEVELRRIVQLDGIPSPRRSLLARKEMITPLAMPTISSGRSSRCSQMGMPEERSRQNHCPMTLSGSSRTCSYQRVSGALAVNRQRGSFFSMAARL